MQSLVSYMSLLVRVYACFGAVNSKPFFALPLLSVCLCGAQRDEQLRPATDKVGQAQECQPLSTRATGQLCFRSQENVVDNALDLVTPTVPYRKY